MIMENITSLLLLLLVFYRWRIVILLEAHEVMLKKMFLVHIKVKDGKKQVLS